MPSSHCTWEAHVRMSEVGPDGLVWPHRVLEWMQEAAVAASSAGGYPQARYQQMNAGWFIREIHLELARPIAHGERVAVETWVADLRRFRSRRQYRVTVDGALVARGEVDWLFLKVDPQTGKIEPLRPDEDMKAAFPIVPERVFAPDEIPAWPKGEPAGASFETRARAVSPTEIDAHRHVNHVHYLAWLEDHAQTTRREAGELRVARLFYEADAKEGDTVEIRGAACADGESLGIYRGEQRLVRALLQR